MNSSNQRTKEDKVKMAKANGVMTKLDIENLGKRQKEIQTIHIENQNQLTEQIATYNNDSSISVEHKNFSQHLLKVQMNDND
jgi:thymidine phosphorylase